MQEYLGSGNPDQTGADESNERSGKEYVALAGLRDLDLAGELESSRARAPELLRATQGAMRYRIHDPSQGQGGDALLIDVLQVIRVGLGRMAERTDNGKVAVLICCTEKNVRNGVLTDRYKLTEPEDSEQVHRKRKQFESRVRLGARKLGEAGKELRQDGLHAKYSPNEGAKKETGPYSQSIL